MIRLTTAKYMRFPFEVGAEGPETSESRADHAREQIEQVLFTDPGERVYRPEFGAGVRAMIFEPNNSVLEQLALQRLTKSLTEALSGEVDPKTIRVKIEARKEELRVFVSYTLATIGKEERMEYSVTP